MCPVVREIRIVFFSWLERTTKKKSSTLKKYSLSIIRLENMLLSKIYIEFPSSSHMQPCGLKVVSPQGHLYTSLSAPPAK